MNDTLRRLQGARVLVTGGCGFLGSEIVRAFLARGAQVRVLALPRESRENVADLDVEVVVGDVRSPEDCVHAVRGCQFVVHAAALYLSHAPDPSRMYEVNLRGTFNMLEAARRAGVARVVYTASVVSLGRPPRGEVGDEDTTYREWELDFPYSRSKFHSRILAQDFAAWGLDVVTICPGIILGPRDLRPTPSGELVIELSKSSTPPVVVEGGAAYVDVRDAAELHALAAEKAAAGSTYIAASENLTNREFYALIDEALGRSRPLVRAPTPVARQMIRGMNKIADLRGQPPALAEVFFEYSLKPSFFSAERSRRELGATYRPASESIRDAIQYFRARGLIR